MTDAIDLTKEQRTTLSALVRRFLPSVVVWAYGSRVKWTARPNSDLDLVAFATPAQRPQVTELKDALAESNLPFPVDLHVWDEVPKRFREIIRKEYVVVQEAKEPDDKRGLAGEWPTLSLREAHVKLIDCDHRTPPAAEEGYPYVAIPQLRNGRIDLSEARRISHEHFADWTRKAMPAANDVVLSRRCNPGETAFVPPGLEFALGQNLVLLRADGVKVYPPFLRWWLQGPEWWEQIGKFLNVGAVFDSLRCADVPNFELHIPSMPEQRAIAHILGTLDDKIDLNRRMNETLEAMARALFKSWFIDFDPVCAKAEGRDPGLPKPLADLFPDRLVDSEMDEIPEGWNALPLRALASYISRGIGPVYIDDGGVRVLNQKCVRDRRVNFLLGRWHDPTKRSIEGRTLRVLDILVNSTGVGTLGRIGQIWDLPESAIADSHVTVIRAANDVDPWFLGVSLIVRESEVETLGEGSTGQIELNRERLGSLPCLTPPLKVQVAFGQVAGKLLSRVAENEKASQSLAALRDTLLPKLISGELRVESVERFCERAV